MAVDAALLAEVAAGAPSALRLYRWRPSAISLGRFQDAADVDPAACGRAGIDVVRRPSGGRALLHGGDLTYAVAMVRPPGRSGSVREVYGLIAAALIDGLARLGVTAAVARHDGADVGPICFAAQQGADLRVGDRKLCGSAQVRARGAGPGPSSRAVLQHGSILLRRLAVDETDLLVAGGDRAALRRATVTLDELGVDAPPRDVAAALVAGFERTLDVEFSPRWPRPRVEIEVQPSPRASGFRASLAP